MTPPKIRTEGAKFVLGSIPGSFLFTAFRSRPWPLERPTVLQFPVNDICNSACQMCDIWKRKLDFQISPEQLETILSDSLFSRVTNVGINGGEPTLRRDLAVLVRVACERLPRLRRFALITNALVPNRVIDSIKSISEVTRSYGKSLDVMVSLDGVGEIHDEVRGRNGNFENALHVLEFLRRQNHASYQLGCTIVKSNVYGLWDLLRFALRQGIYVKFRLGVPHRRLYAYDTREAFELDEEQRYHICTFLQALIANYETGAQQLETYRSLIGQIAYQTPRSAGCNWQHRGVTLTARGELAYCAVESDTLGSAAETSAEKIYFGNADHLRNIVATKCANCSHDYGGITPGLGVIRQLAYSVGFTPVAMNVSSSHRKLLLPIARFSFAAHEYRLRRLSRRDWQHSSASAPGVVRRIAICGWYGTETLGDKAILAGVVMALRAVMGPCEITICSLAPFITLHTVSQMPELRGSSVVDYPTGIARIRDFDGIVFGGGPIMGVRALAENIALFECAKRRGIPRVILGCGIGPIVRRYHRRAVRKLLDLSTARVYRDRESYELASDLGVDTTTDCVAEDPALLWLSEARTKAISTPQGTPRLMLGLRDWPHEQYGTHGRNGAILRDRVEREILESISQLLEGSASLTLVPFPMCTNSAGGDDRWFYSRIFSTVQSLDKRIDWSLVANEYSPAAALQEFRKSTAVLAMRYHALVFAAAARVPTLALDYAGSRGKIRPFARAVSAPSVPLEDISARELTSRLERLLFQPGTPPGDPCTNLKLSGILRSIAHASF